MRALLQQLPGAARLERLLAWEGGDRPELPELVRDANPLPPLLFRSPLAARACNLVLQLPLLLVPPLPTTPHNHSLYPPAFYRLPHQTPKEALQRRAVETSHQQLPPGVRPLPQTRHLAGVCDACGTEAEYDGDWLVECDKCRCVGGFGSCMALAWACMGSHAARMGSHGACMCSASNPRP